MDSNIPLIIVYLNYILKSVHRLYTCLGEFISLQYSIILNIY